MRAARCGVILATLFILPTLLSQSAQASTSAAAWRLDAPAQPTNFSMADNASCQAATSICDSYHVIATNVGSKPADGSSVTLSGFVPEGLAVGRVAFFWKELPEADGGPQTDLHFFCTRRW